MATHYSRAADRERTIVRRHRANNHISARSAGSHSPIDVWAIDPVNKIIFLYQCKKRKGGFLKEDGAERKWVEDLRNELAYLEGTYQVKVLIK